MNREERVGLLAGNFKRAYGSNPVIWSRAPGRVDLMGSHTDYNNGYVMTMTTDLDTWIAGRPRTDGKVRIRSLNAAGEGLFSLDDVRAAKDVTWSNYVRGMAYALQKAGYELHGFDGLIHSIVPFGSGLSSSAALEMAAGVMFQLLSAFAIDPVQMALLGQEAENDFVGVKTGILDQYSSALGQKGCAIQLDCRDLTSENVNIADGLQVVICDTRAERNLVGSEYDDRRAQCEAGAAWLQGHDPNIRSLRDVNLSFFETYESELPPIIAKRCRFIIEESQRVLDLAPALSLGVESKLRELFLASYYGARDLFEIGVPAMEAMMEAMMGGPGVIGARQAGAGFGGCMVAVVRESEVSPFSSHVQEMYLQQTGIQPQIVAVSASPGAGKLSI